MSQANHKHCRGADWLAWLFSFLFLILFCSPISAQTDGTGDWPLIITNSGYFLTTVDAEGTPTYVKLTTVIDLTGDNIPEPPDPDEPKVDLEIVRKVQGWAKAVDDPQSAQAIAMVYSHIRGALEDATLTDTTVWVALQKAMVSALSLIDSRKDWTEWRSQVTEVLTEAKQRGQLQSSQQIELMLLSIQHGVELAADGSTALSMDQLVELARRTNDAIDGATQ